MPPRACARRPFEKSARAGLRECPHALRWAPARDPSPASVTEPRREDGEVHDEKEGGDPQHPEPRPEASEGRRVEPDLDNEAGEIHRRAGDEKRVAEARHNHCERGEPAADLVAQQLPGKEPVSNGVQHTHVNGEDRDAAHDRSDFSLKLAPVVDDIPIIPNTVRVQDTPQAHVHGIEERVEVTLTVRGPLAAYLPPRCEEGATETHQTVHPHLQDPKKHLVSDINALTNDPSVGIYEAVDTAHTSNHRVNEIPNNARNTINCQNNRDIKEDQDLSRHYLD